MDLKLIKNCFGDGILISLGNSLWKYRRLIFKLTWRDFITRYKGAYLGFWWSLIHPLVMLFIYTFVFSVIFKVKWGLDDDEGKAAFALALFAGLITFRIFADVAGEAPSILLKNINFVKKVVFPLEILPIVLFLNVLINALISLMILLIGLLIINYKIYLTALLLPIVWLPVIFFSIGTGYFLCSAGAIIKDLKNLSDILISILLFLSPIFYPLHAVPVNFQIFIKINPIAVCIEDVRRVVLLGLMPQWSWFLYNLLFSCVIFYFGVRWFYKTKKSFAEIL